MILQNFAELTRNRELILEIVKREQFNRHAGSVLGVLWSYGHVLALMVLYMILFAYVFPTRFDTGSGASGDFSVSVIAGVLQWLAFQEALGRAPTVLIGAQNLVKQIVFPIQVLPVSHAISGALPYGFAVIIVSFYAFYMGTASLLLAALPLILILHLMAIVGFVYFLSAFGVFFRDVKELITVFLSVNLFAQPILYNPSAIPSFLEKFFYFNPFSYACWVWQDLLYHGVITRPYAWCVYSLLCICSYLVGLSVFKRLQPHFGDLL